MSKPNCVYFRASKNYTMGFPPSISLVVVTDPGSTRRLNCYKPTEPKDRWMFATTKNPVACGPHAQNQDYREALMDLRRSKYAIRSGLPHDLEHASAARGTCALHGTTTVGHNVLFRIFHHPFCFALYAIAFYAICHFLWCFEVT